MFGFITGVLGLIWDGVQAGLDAIVIALQWAAGALKTGLLGAWSAVRFTWNDIVKPIGRLLDDAFEGVKTLYKDIVKPALDWLDRVTAGLRKVYNAVFRPILNLFDHVRQVLQLLELLHVPFAAKLDAELADLERKISLPLQLVIRVLNGLSNRVESYVLTAENLFQRVTHLATFERDVKAIANIHWNAWSSGLSPAAKSKPGAPAQLASADEHVQLLDDTLKNDAVGDGIDIVGAVALLETVLAD